MSESGAAGAAGAAGADADRAEAALAAARAVFVQPHLDDVALSCGGAVARAADAGERPVVVGVFTGPPGPARPLPEAVRALHARWGLGDDAWLARRAEDERACAALGAAPLWLPLQDAPYRGYETLAAIFGGLPAGDPVIARVATELLALWRRTAGAVVYLPLGVGGHVDHLACHAAGAALEAAGAEVRYYEDYPYAAIPGLLPARLAELAAGATGAAGGARGGLGLDIERDDVTPWIDRRVRAAEAYASQLPSLFGPGGATPGPPGDAIRGYAAAVAGGLPGLASGARLAECFYRRAGAAATRG